MARRPAPVGNACSKGPSAPEKDIEARRAESSSIYFSLLQAVERDARPAAASSPQRWPSGSSCSSSVCFAMIHGLRSVGDGRRTGPEGRRRLRGHRRSPGQCGRQHITCRGQLPLCAVFGGIVLAFTARSLVTVLRIVNRLIWGVTPSGHPTPWAPPILIGHVTVLFGVIDLAAWLGSQSLGLRFVATSHHPHVGCRLAPGERGGCPERNVSGGSFFPAHSSSASVLGVLHLSNDHRRCACGLEEVLPLRRNRDRVGAAPLDLLRRPTADGLHRRQRIAVAAPAHRTGRAINPRVGGPERALW